MHIHVVKCAAAHQAFDDFLVGQLSVHSGTEIDHSREGATVCTFGDDPFRRTVSDVLDAGEAIPKLLSFWAEPDAAMVDVRWQNFQSHLGGFANEDGDFIEVSDLAAEQCRHELGGVVGLHVCGLVGHDCVAGAMGFVEAIPGELLHIIEDATGQLVVDVVGFFAALDEAFPMLLHDLGDFLSHGTP